MRGIHGVRLGFSYRKLSGTGVDSPYEAPEAPELHLDTNLLEPEEAAELVIEAMVQAGIFEARPAAANDPAAEDA